MSNKKTRKHINNLKSRSANIPVTWMDVETISEYEEEFPKQTKHQKSRMRKSLRRRK